MHKHQYSGNHAVTDINLDNVCKKGNTLLWDLVQDEDAVGPLRSSFEFHIVTESELLFFCPNCLGPTSLHTNQYI